MSRLQTDKQLDSGSLASLVTNVQTKTGPLDRLKSYKHLMPVNYLAAVCFKAKNIF